MLVLLVLEMGASYICVMDKRSGTRLVGGKYQARIKIGDARISLGLFDTKEKAEAAYASARSKAPPIRWADKELTNKRLKQLVEYDPESGRFYRVGRAGVKGGPVNSVPNKAVGYRYMRVDGRRYMAHRIAWLYMTGRWPVADIDHINGDRADNRFVNLREATRSENCQNRPIASTNRSGLRGVSWHRASHKFVSRITVNGRRFDLGYFHTAQEAHSAYLKAKAEKHKFQPVPR